MTPLQKLNFEAEMSAVPLSEAEASAYLGDLLYHAREYDAAETHLQKAVVHDAGSSLANTPLGLVKMRQRKFDDDAKKYLEKAIAGDAKNHYAHYNYAYILSRESMDEFGYVTKFLAESMKKMRESLQKAIVTNPNFTESYHLLGYINLVNNEQLEESLAVMAKALQLQPGSQEYAFIIAQIYLRQQKFAEAKELAEKLVKTADEPNLRSNAQNLLNSIRQYEEQKAQYQSQVKDLEDKGIRLIRREEGKKLTPEERARIKEENEINSLNQLLEKPKPDEKMIVGRIERVACVKGEVNYTVVAETGTLALRSKDFNDLTLSSMSPEAQNVEFGCDAAVKDILTVMTYRPSADVKSKSQGTLLAITFVPKYFRLKTDEEMAQAKLVVEDEEPAAEERRENPSEQAGFEEQRREAMLRAIAENLRQPQAGEKREVGVVEKIECSGSVVTFVVKTETQALRLKTKSLQSVKLVIFTPDGAQMQIGCGARPAPIPAVITYRPDGKQGGEMIALEFVPKSFKLP